jgi:hypothetical protein
LSLAEGDTENLGAVVFELSKEEVKQLDEVECTSARVPKLDAGDPKETGWIPPLPDSNNDREKGGEDQFNFGTKMLAPAPN